MPDLQQWSPPLFDVLAVFRLHCQAQRYRPATLDFYDKRLPPFAAWLAARGVDQLRDITANHVRAYIVEYQTGGASPGYVHGIAAALRAFLNFCVAEGWLDASPMRNVAMPKVPRAILPAFTPEQIAALLKAAADERDRAVLLALLDTGLRAAEFVALRGGDIDAQSGAVHVRHGKGDKARIVYLGAKSLRALLRYYMRRGVPPADGAVWISERAPHAPLTYSGVAQLLRRIGAAAGVPHCTPHTFRRTFALQCLRNGMDIYSLRRLMGHEDIAVLRQYLDLVHSDDATAHRRFGVVDNL